MITMRLFNTFIKVDENTDKLLYWVGFFDKHKYDKFNNWKYREIGFPTLHEMLEFVNKQMLKNSIEYKRTLLRAKKQHNNKRIKNEK